MRSKRQTKIEVTRKLRKQPTMAEERLWWILRNRLMLGFKFRRQYVFKGFILDFYCPQARLGIELDGGVHAKQQGYDQARQELIEDHGIKILRFKNNELFKKPIGVLKAITSNLPISAFSSLRRRGTIAEGDGG